MKLDLLLVNPNARRQAYQSLADQTCAIEPPIWCALIAGFIRQRGFNVAILDANAEGLSAVESAERVKDAKARLTAVVCYGQHPSASTQVMPAAINLVAAIKKLHDCKVMVVGGHVAALPERSLQESGADYACTGEGCYTILDLLQGKSLVDCRGLVAVERFGRVADTDTYLGTAVMTNNPAPNVQNLDLEMQMAWDLLPPLDKYRAHNWQSWATPEFGRSPYFATYSTIGCKWSCHFCMIQSPFREGDKLDLKLRGANSYRYWNPDSIGKQIAELYYDHGVKTFKIADEMFVLNRKHVLGVCEAIGKRIRNPHDRLNIWAYARVDTCNDTELLTALRSAGFRWLAIGVESASEQVRDGVAKGFAQDKIAACFNRVKAAGIHVGANYIFGLPGDTMETMEATYDLACELNTPYANFYASMCYPGSKMWHDYPEHHALPWTAFAQFGYDCHPTATATLTSVEVLAFRERAFHGYFSRPGYLVMMEREFGPAAVEDVKRMESTHIKFKLLEEQHGGQARHKTGCKNEGVVEDVVDLQTT
jgi:anaerobic magnesium-protoporphyrin IX monomethyl ester cyclase